MRRMVYRIAAALGVLAVIGLLLYHVGIPAFVTRNVMAKMHYSRFVSGEGAYRGAEYCATCHPQHYEQWSRSLHSKATTEAHFPLRVQQLGWGMPREACLDCHGPLPRTTEEGVSCEVCHGPGDTMAVVEDICVRCHKGEPMLITPIEFEGSQAKAEGQTCAGCHLPAQGGMHFHGFEGSRTAPETYRGAVTIEAIERRGSRLDVTVKNNVEGHYIPTAAPENVLFLEVIGRDAVGDEVYRSEYRFDKQAYWFRTMPMWFRSDNRLRDGERRAVTFSIPPAVSSATVSLSIRPFQWNGEVVRQEVGLKAVSLP